MFSHQPITRHNNIVEVVYTATRSVDKASSVNDVFIMTYDILLGVGFLVNARKGLLIPTLVAWLMPKSCRLREFRCGVVSPRQSQCV